VRRNRSREAHHCPVPSLVQLDFVLWCGENRNPWTILAVDPYICGGIAVNRKTIVAAVLAKAKRGNGPANMGVDGRTQTAGTGVGQTRRRAHPNTRPWNLGRKWPTLWQRSGFWYQAEREFREGRRTRNAGRRYLTAFRRRREYTGDTPLGGVTRRSRPLVTSGKTPGQRWERWVPIVWAGDWRNYPVA